MTFAMQGLWTVTDNIDRHLCVHMPELERLKNSLYYCNVQRDLWIRQSEFCIRCGGFCVTKYNKLLHLKLLAKNLNNLVSCLLDTLPVKCAPVITDGSQSAPQSPPSTPDSSRP